MYPFGSTRSLLLLALIVTGIAAGLCLWIAWCEFPLYAWNDSRLLPAFVLRDGLNPYPPLGGGPLTTWIYGPMGILINLPATFASTLVTALQTAWLINTIVVLGPIALIFLTSQELRQRGWWRLAYAFCLAVLLVPRPNLTLQVADHLAIACSLLSLWCLAKPEELRPTAVIASAGLATLAIWSKQLSIFLPMVHLAYFVLVKKRGEIQRYLVWLAVFNVVALIVFGAWFGYSNLWFNCVELPARLGWADPVERIKLRAFALIGQVLVPPAAVWIIWRKKMWPTRHSATGRFLWLGTLAYAAMLPVGLAAFFKIGGDTNLLHSWDYFMPAALLCWLARSHQTPSRMSAPLLAGILALALHLKDFSSIPLRPYTRHFESAAELTARFPHGIWFPQNPLINYFAEHRFFHTEDGVSTRFLAGYGIREVEFKRYLPPKLQAVAYPSNNNSPFSLPLLPEFSTKEHVPYWNLYEKAVSDMSPL